MTAEIHDYTEARIKQLLDKMDEEIRRYDGIDDELPRKYVAKLKKHRALLDQSDDVEEPEEDVSPTAERGPASDRAYQLAHEMQEQIHPHDSDDDVFDAVQMTIMYMHDNHPGAFDRFVKHCLDQVIGGAFDVYAEKARAEALSTIKKDED